MLDLFVSELTIGRRVLSGQMRFIVPKGEIHVLSGPNGCGKSLLLDAAVGTGPAEGLSIRLNGKPLDNLGPAARWQSGLRRMFQSPIIPGDATVGQAIEYAKLHGRQSKRQDQNMRHLLDKAGMADDMAISSLSYGQRRVVELCLSLHSLHATLLDEPFSGLSPRLVAVASELIAGAAAEGMAIVVIEHLPQESGLHYALEHAWAMPAEAFFRKGNREAIEPIPPGISREWERRVGVNWDIGRLQIGGRVLFESCKIILRPKEFIAISGSNGSGKSTALRALAGNKQPWVTGQLEIDPRLEFLRFHLSPQPPKLLADFSVCDNLNCMLLDGGSDPDGRMARARRLLQWMGLNDGQIWNQWAGDLSGGEASTVALVGAVASPHPVLLLDEPFEGMSATTLPRAQRLLSSALSMGKSAIITTHDPRQMNRAKQDARISLGSTFATTGSVGSCPYHDLLEDGEIK